MVVAVVTEIHTEAGAAVIQEVAALILAHGLEAEVALIITGLTK